MRHDVSNVLYSSVFLLAINFALFFSPNVQRFEHCVEKRFIKCHYYYNIIIII